MDDGADGAALLLNPLGEFVSSHDSDPVEENFKDFRRKHGKEYADPVEHQKRKHIFRHNLRWVPAPATRIKSSRKSFHYDRFKRNFCLDCKIWF